MTESSPPDLSQLPSAVAAEKNKHSLQLVWIIPIVAAIIGGWLAVKAIMAQGPTITMVFQSADGLEAGKTQIRFKDIKVGLVQSIALSEDAKTVIVTADIDKTAEPFIVESSRFWVVRPRITGGGISGLNTLLSGAFIGMDPGPSKVKKLHFVGLASPPQVEEGTPGKEFILHSHRLGSLDVGSPLYYRQLPAGQITAYQLDQDGQGVTFKVFVAQPFDKYVNANTRFWNASGVDVNIDANGIKVNTESLTSLLLGGLAFENPPQSADLAPSPSDTEYTLFSNYDLAMKNPDKEVFKFTIVFDESVRGLAPGAILDFRGISIGEVTAIKVDLQPKTRKIDMVAEINLYPGRLRNRAVKKQEVLSLRQRQEFFQALYDKGLRAQLRTGNLLTGQLYIALDFFPNAPKIHQSLFASEPWQMPAMPSNMSELQSSLYGIVKKIEAIPTQQLGADLHQTLQSANRLLTNMDSDLVPQARETLRNANTLMQNLDGELKEASPEVRAALVEARKTLSEASRLMSSDSPLQNDARMAMREVGRAAQSLRILADYLEQHPEALLKGKTENAK